MGQCRQYDFYEAQNQQALFLDGGQPHAGTNNRRSAAFYRYDAGGERELKLLASVKDANVNGRDYKQLVYDYAVLYASGGLMTVDAAGYKKHYFMEGERILTSIGGGGSPNIGPNEELATITEVIIEDISEKYFDKYVSSYFPEHVNEGVGNPLEIPGDLDKVPDLYKRFDIYVNQSISDIPYYYVPDYLGSGSVITNANANAVHMLAYIPFGEILLDLNNGFETPYKFAGYEHDQESGLSYASARYYAGMSRYPIFLSVDPLAEKYPGWSPYAYCLNNPVNRVDPTGLDSHIVLYSSSDERFRAAAETRKREIEGTKGFDPRKDHVYMMEIGDLGTLSDRVSSVVKDATDNGYGKTVEASFYTHGGLDGPLGDSPTSGQYSLSDITGNQFDNRQLSIDGWSNINWNFNSNNSVAAFYGCRTAGFAERFFDYSNVQYTAGQGGRVGPSYSIDKFDNVGYLIGVFGTSRNVYYGDQADGNFYGVTAYGRDVYELTLYGRMRKVFEAKGNVSVTGGKLRIR